MVLTVLGYLADVLILGTYALMLRGHSPRWFHLGNGLGAAPLILIEVVSRAWPVLPVTATFGILGWAGVYATRRRPEGDVQLVDATVQISEVTASPHFLESMPPELRKEVLKSLRRDAT